MVQLAVLIAIMLILAFTPLGYLRIGPLAISLMTIPVVIGAMILGPAGGAVLGLVFGLTSFYQCFAGDSDDLLRSYRVSAEHECNRSESVYVRRSILWYQRSTGDAYELCSRWWRCEGSQRSTEEECSNRREIIRFPETKNI